MNIVLLFYTWKLLFYLLLEVAKYVCINTGNILFSYEHFSCWVNNCNASEKEDIMHQIHAWWNSFERYGAKPEINLVPCAHKKQSGLQTLRPARIFYGGSQEQPMRKRQWFVWEEMSYVLFCSLLRVNNIICFFNRIKILEVIKNRKIWNKLNSVFEKNASKV